MSDWKDLEEAFRAGGGPPVGEGDLRRYRRRQLVSLAVEVAAGVAVLAFYAVGLVRSPSPPLVALALATTLFLGVYLTYLFLNRRAVLQDAALPTDAWHAVLRRRAAADLRWNGFLTRSLAGMAIFGVVWGAWQVLHFREVYSAEPWRAVVGFGIYYGILGAMWLVQRRKRPGLEARLAELGDVGAC